MDEVIVQECVADRLESFIYFLFLKDWQAMDSDTAQTHMFRMHRL